VINIILVIELIFLRILLDICNHILNVGRLLDSLVDPFPFALILGSGSDGKPLEKRRMQIACVYPNLFHH
jgi:hypothetical protein